ncbi:VWA domain-containing protein [Lysobacter pythonis]|uniref:VWA domain-containing protein n=1 Tax=Solilutibacter pythonis TaxID=2483112 RepID=A0A3M2I4L2_9GAMM|nr:VWA domain-containing protein [Lysobacter pythonis]RMH93427.1 VWA domain-containing protein [Lysobacter pythonis]
MLAALPLPLLAWWWLPPARAATAAALKLPQAETRVHAVPAVARSMRGRGFDFVAFIAWALLCIAAARPQTLGPVEAPPQTGRDLMLAVDLSGSMEAPDMELGGRQVERLTAAKAVLADFLDRRASDRIGLIVFGQRAYAITPLTRDRDSVRRQLRDAMVGMAGRETAIGDAIGLAVKRLRAQPAEHRVLILLTDGDNTAGTLTPGKAAELARAERVRIHAIAFGGEEAAISMLGVRIPVPGMQAGIDEAVLREVAETTGGRFFRAGDTRSLAGIYAEIDRLEPVTREGPAVRPRIEHYWRWLGMAWGVAVLAFALRLRRRRA